MLLLTLGALTPACVDAYPAQRSRADPFCPEGARMGPDLSGPAGDFWWDCFSWHKLLRVAERYGWQPAGTVLAEDELQFMPGGVWSGRYTTNDFQAVTAADAEQLAAALKRALPDIADADILAQLRTESGALSSPRTGR
jgi:hypothetical protein